MNNVYRGILKKNGFVKVNNFFSDAEKRILLRYFDNIEELKEEKNKQMIYFEENNKKSRIEYFYKYHYGIQNIILSTIKPFLENILVDEQVLFKDKMNWKYPNGNGFKGHQDHCAWNDFNVSVFHSIALSGNNSNKENGCLQFSNYNNNIILEQSNNLGEIEDSIEKCLNWEYVETTPSDLVIFNSYVPHKSEKNNSNNARRIMYFTFNSKKEGDFYEEYNKKKREYFPPNIERTKEFNFKNNKYNLANPIL